MITITGHKEAIKKLQKLREKVYKDALRRGTREGAKLLQRRAVITCPERSGMLKRNLKVRSIPRSRIWIGAMVTLKLPNSPVYYGGFVNYGTRYQRAQRFLNNTADNVGQEAIEVARKALTEDITAL